MKTTNSLNHKIKTVDSEGNTLHIEISLSDPCNNGHEDFAITATAWEKGKRLTDRNNIYCGCCHEEILKVHPELKMFVDLHLSSYEGVPMYALENGWHHIANESACAQSYIRATDVEFKALKKCKNMVFFSKELNALGIPNRWAQEAAAAIAKLEEMTGEKFQSKNA